MFDLNRFIEKNVTKRENSMFEADINSHRKLLEGKIRDRKILVIGGAGSIGSSFIECILPYRPASLTVADTDENALAELTRKLRAEPGMYVPDAYVTYPMDYASGTFQRMFRAYGGFDIVANFAAHKHVRSEKDRYSIEALLYNNVIHAAGLMELLSGYPPEAYFCVSTDKAANPVNIMGASKRIMEDLIFCYSGKFPVKTARFANVAFSNGSLPAGFLKRVGRLQPLSAPLGIKRYFVSPEESGQICMLSCMLGGNREIFFPKLEEAQMMGFDGIAAQLVKAYGYEPLICKSNQQALEAAAALREGAAGYPIHVSDADTSGEKPYEEFFTESECTDMGRFLSLGVITGKQIPDAGNVQRLLSGLEKAFQESDLRKERIVELISSYLPGFRHIETGKSLDGKM